MPFDIKKIFLDKKTLEKIDFFRKIPLFNDLSSQELATVLDIMYMKDYQPDETIFKEGDLGKAMFIIRSGEIEVLKKGKVLASLSEGDFFGEMALLEQLPRSAAVKTVKTSQIYLIYKANFDGLLDRHPRIGIKLIRKLLNVMSERLRKTSEKLS